MKLSIIWLLDEKGESEQTLSWIKNDYCGVQEKPQIILYAGEKSGEGYRDALSEFDCVLKDRSFRDDAACLNDAAQLVTGDLVTAIHSGDTFSEEMEKSLEKAAEKYPQETIFMLRKVMPGGKDGAFSSASNTQRDVVVSLKKDFAHYPFYFGGTFIRREYFREHAFRSELGLEAEREYFLRLCMEKMHFVFCQHIHYYSGEAREGDFTFFRNIYEKEWYEESFDGFWIPFLEEIKREREHIPLFVQYHVMFTIRNRMSSNWNNRNKHVITEGKEEEVLAAIGRTLKLVESLVIYNGHKVKESNTTDSLKWIYGVLRNGPNFCYDKFFLSGIPYYGANNIVMNRISNLKTNIVFMNYEDGILHIDGTVHPILFSMSDSVYFVFGGKKYPLEYNGRYALNKVFGVSVYKSHSFHVKLPMDQMGDGLLVCMAKIRGDEVRIAFSYESHFSRLSSTYKMSYWCFGREPMYMAVRAGDGIRFEVSAAKAKRRREWKLEKEMFLSLKKRAWLFLLIRRAYFVMKPIMKRRPIWMYLDKIYKAGDSSEYLYRYASAQKDGIKHYYLVDRKASDYRRLKEDGFTPLVRGSIKHRLVFLMADMMVISNSTVFAFNNFGMPNSSNVRDLVDFHVCCVQHGMSVQKIAVAQNRLRDNTRLYFCASQYEIENLSRPIYDYVGYDALKLTGVPRYDGLVNDDKRQIMISPTWRMQAAVPVRTSEGEQRDYNPLFTESTYFKVFNSLINDPRLIAAAKQFGYRIKYVLHPIVSAQVDDFDRNDYVDIIPAVGDMSYERMFCESSLMVTDFSGIQFDFAYMRKPLVYLHHRDIPQHYEEGTFFYDTMAFGEIANDNDELIDLLCEYMENGCKMKEEYVRRADDFFYYSDHNNCKRIYDIMREYQDRHILHR